MFRKFATSNNLLLLQYVKHWDFICFQNSVHCFYKAAFLTLFCLRAYVKLVCSLFFYGERVLMSSGQCMSMCVYLSIHPFIHPSIVSFEHSHAQFLSIHVHCFSIKQTIQTTQGPSRKAAGIWFTPHPLPMALEGYGSSAPALFPLHMSLVSTLKFRFFHLFS